MSAIFKRELKSYFSSPIGYVCVGAILFLYGMFYYMVMLNRRSDYIGTQVFGSMFTWGMMIIPIITMRSLSEDRKNKTDQALITAPVSVTGIVWGKFTAAFGVYFIATTLALLPAIVIGMYASPSWGLIFGNYLGSLLYGAAMISIGVFLSSLTESQIIAAITTFGVSIILLMIDSLAGSVGGFMAQVVSWISFQARYSPFTTGTFNVSSIVFFLSVVAIFNFVTARRLESRRWS